VIQLSAQVAAIAVVTLLVRELAGRYGPKMAFPTAAAVTVAVFLAAIALGNVRESWHGLDLQRAHTKGLSARQGQETCTAVGVDPYFLGWIGARIPSRAKYFMVVAPNLMGGGDICIRQLLFPRVQEQDPAGVRYFVFFGRVDQALLADLKARGATILRYPKRASLLARLP
jgi:hypothetical protein